MVRRWLSADLTARLRSPGPILALTGAGVSAESGLPTFRGPGGLWEGRDPLELATHGAFRDDPETVWRFYAWRREQAAAAQPNPAHRVLAEFEHEREDFQLVTQNVDGLHERAGNERLVRLHGTLWMSRCVAEGRETLDSRTTFDPFPPRCERCGELLRPGVVWFGEPLPGEALQSAERAARRAALVLVVGTSSMVYPAAGLPQVARSAGAYVVEINPEPTPLSSIANERLAGPAAEVLPEIAGAAGLTSETPA